MLEKRWYSVNEVLDICNVTRRQLYYYEEKGIIQPYRNEDNNYRLYSEKDIMRIFFICECRNLDLSMASIKKLLDQPTADTLKSIIKETKFAVQQEMERQLLAYETKMQRYNSLLDATNLVSKSNADLIKIGIAYLEECNIVYLNTQCSITDSFFCYAKPFIDLENIIKNEGYTKLSSRKCIFSNVVIKNRDIVIPYSKNACFFYEVKEEKLQSKNFMKFKGCNALYTFCIGGNKNKFADCYSRMINYAKEHDYQLTGDLIEEYIVGPVLYFNNSDEWVTKIYLPFK